MASQIQVFKSVFYVFDNTTTLKNDEIQLNLQDINQTPILEI